MLFLILKNAITSILQLSGQLNVGFLILIPSTIALTSIFIGVFPIFLLVSIILPTNAIVNAIRQQVFQRQSVTDNLPKGYIQVKEAIQQLVKEKKMGPLLVRLGFHTSGTYDINTGKGGSNGATIRFPEELNRPQNAGIQIALKALEPIKKKFDWISYADLYTFAGPVAIETLGGPVIPWRPGRIDFTSGSSPDNLPKGLENIYELRTQVFYRMGFGDTELVALQGGHTLGMAHADRNGFVGPWTVAPQRFTNFYFVNLVFIPWFP